MYYYDQKYPNEGDLVMIEIKSVSENGNVYVYLLEYGNIEGMIPQNELTNRRLKSYKSFKVGKVDVARVLSVDQERGYVDLSKKSVSQDENVECIERWSKTRFVYTVMCGLSISRDVSVSELYEKVVWPLDKKYGHTYNAFLSYLSNPESIPEINDNKDMTDIINHKLRAKLTTLQKVIDVTCFQKEGIDAIKDALKRVNDVSEEITVRYMVPSFSLSITTADKENGIKLLDQAYQAVSQRIQEFGGTVTLKNDYSGEL
jgi:translation initiation factor 2 subunit 1